LSVGTWWLKNFALRKRLLDAQGLHRAALAAAGIHRCAPALHGIVLKWSAKCTYFKRITSSRVHILHIAAALALALAWPAPGKAMANVKVWQLAVTQRVQLRNMYYITLPIALQPHTILA
jgi:hypothetical protein